MAPRDNRGFPFRRPWPWLVVAFSLLTIAITHATFRVPQVTYRYLFVLDITQSMNVLDMESGNLPISRLDFAKSIIETALNELPCGSEAGLAIFTEHRTFVMFSPVEICEHYQVLSEMLAAIDWNMAWVARSEVAKGLYSAFDSALQMKQDTRLVFLSDGHEAPPINKNLLPPFSGQPQSVMGFIGGIGAVQPSRIPHLDENGKVVGFWSHDEVMQVDIHSLGRGGTETGEAMAGIDIGNIARRIMLGQEHLSALQEAYLQELATQTGLDYVHIESPTNFIATLRTEKYARRTRVLTDLGWIPAAFAFACLFYCFVILPGLSRHASTNGRSLEAA